MARIEKFHRGRRDPDKGIRDWDEAHVRRQRYAPSRHPYRPRRGLVGSFRQIYGIAALLAVLALAAWPQVEPALASLPMASNVLSSDPSPSVKYPDKRISRSFPICGSGPRHNCVVDGDTFWFEGKKVRIADIDTPEVSKPRCRAEKREGERATRRLQGLLNSGSFEMTGSGTDKYGRDLRTLHRNGRSLGETLVDEGLAHQWRGHKESWCG